MNLYLMGCRGSGKSTVGPLVARRLGRPFIDLDERIASEAGRDIGEIFAVEGEEGFRRREHACCQRLKRVRRHVIALGGGTLMDPQNRQLLKRGGKFIWLQAPAAVLWSRINQDPHTAHMRPDLTPGGGLPELEMTVAQREPTFQAIAHHVIDTVSASPEEIVESIELWYQANDMHS
ncbi:MAG: shikimate kinase [Phycisphaerae bacterium]